MAMDVLFIGAHPDDNEFCIGGTAALMAQRGDHIRLVSVTDGSKGHYLPEYVSDPESLARRRYAEATAAAGMIGGEYMTMGLPDGEVYVTQANTEEMVRLIRNAGAPGKGPDLVVINRPCDYHRDHRYTAQLALDASYMLTVPAMCPDTPFLHRMPVFAYWHDDFTESGPFQADVLVAIDSVMDTKARMAAAHASQVFEWLPFNAGVLDGVPSDEAGRLQYAADRVARRARTQRDEHDNAPYMPAASGSAQYIESFQISEYGLRPSAEELLRIFPSAHLTSATR